MTAQLGSILLGSTDPDRLRAWYRAALSPAEVPDGFLDFGGMRVLIDERSDVGPANPEPGRVILNFHVADAMATARHLDALGVTWLSPVERRGGNMFGTLIDPDGNYIQIIELSAEHVARGHGQ
ncbi:MAG TPA: VOC family protein [Streptosporangiaceae bacterium]|jgi:catechol 2,3-dioxygenase-like lactoylglutathione lyase family enzyme